MKIDNAENPSRFKVTLPLSYEKSLSYLEQISCIVKATNLLHEKVTSVETKFNEIKTAYDEIKEEIPKIIGTVDTVAELQEEFKTIKEEFKTIEEAIPQVISVVDDITEIKDKLDELTDKVTVIESAIDKLDEYVKKTDIVDNLISSDTDKPLSANMGKELNEKIANCLSSDDVINDLNSSDTDKPLSANMGKELNDKIGSFLSADAVINDLNSSDTDKPLSANMGKVLDEKINEVSENVNEKLSSDDVINALDSSDTDKPLSANMGKELSEEIGTIEDNISTMQTDIANKYTQLNLQDVELQIDGYVTPVFGTVRNSIEGNVYHKRIGRVALWNLNWVVTSVSGNDYQVFAVFNGDINAKVGNLETACALFPYSVNENTPNTSRISTISNFGVRFTVGTDRVPNKTVDEFKNYLAVNEVYLYYELASEETYSVQKPSRINNLESAIGNTVNLLNPTLRDTVENGVTCHYNEDGTYTLNGTASANILFYLIGNYSTQLITNQPTKLVGCPVGGTNTTYRLSLRNNNGTFVRDYGNGISVIAGTNTYVAIEILNGYVCNNLVFKPMLTTNLSATIDDFVPFTGATGKLNSDVAELNKGVTELQKAKVTTSTKNGYYVNGKVFGSTLTIFENLCEIFGETDSLLGVYGILSFACAGQVPKDFPSNCNTYGGGFIQVGGYYINIVYEADDHILYWGRIKHNGTALHWAKTNMTQI